MGTAGAARTRTVERSGQHATRFAPAAPATTVGVGAPQVAPLTAAGLESLQRQAGNQAVARLVLQRRAGGGAAKEIHKRRGKGYARYAAEKLVDRLREMRARGTLTVDGKPLDISDGDLFVLESVAKVESGGAVNALNTWDDMIVSLGFKQVTLVHGSLYKVIRMAPEGFAAHGISIGGGTWKFKTRSGETSQPTIAGVDNPQDLRGEPWASRFYDAGMEDSVVAAVVKYALDEIGGFERRVAKQSKGATSNWMKDPTARAWLVETFNNRPAFALTAAKATNARTATAKLSRDEFLDILGEEIIRAYSVRKEEEKGRRILAKIPRDPKLVPAGAASNAASGAAGAAKAPAPSPKAAKTGPLTDAITKVIPAAKAGGGSFEAIAQLAATLFGDTLISAMVSTGFRDENQLTNLAFWLRHPSLFGTKLLPGQPGFAELSKEWIGLRTTTVLPALRAAKAAPKPPAVDTPVAKPAKPESKAAAPGPASTPASAGPTAKPGGAAAGVASTGAKFFAQDPGRYRHTNAKGVETIWKNGTSGANTCNMTSVTMALVNMSSEADVRSRVISLLQQEGGMHVGAAVEIRDPDTNAKVWVDLADALADPKKAARIYLVDLVTAAALGATRSYPSVIEWSVIAEIARRTGLARKSGTVKGDRSLSSEKGRKNAKNLLARGDRIIGHTQNHFVFLLEVRDDAAVVHDPAGARVQPDDKGKRFLHRGYASSAASEWHKFDDSRREAAGRRVSEHSRNKTLVDALAALPVDKPKQSKEWAAAVKALAKEHPGLFEMGERNVYPLADITSYHMTLAINVTDR